MLQTYSSTYSIELVDSHGGRVGAEVEVTVREWTADERRHRPCTVRLAWRDHSVEATEFSVYHAFQKVREQLEAHDLIPYCFGACPDVRVSGMAVDMGDGTLAYRMSKSTGVGRPPMVNIFESEPGLTLGSVAEQRAPWNG